MHTCAACGALNAEQRYCGNCGAILPTEPSTVATREEAPLAAPSWRPTSAPPPSPAGTRKAGRSSTGRWIAAVAATVAVTSVVVAVAVANRSGGDDHGSSEVSSGHTITGVMEVPLDVANASENFPCGLSLDDLIDLMDQVSDDPESTTECSGGPGGGYSDISDGAQVTVSDASGRIIAVGQLSNGRIVKGIYVDFDLTVSDVPDSDVYQVEVAHRGSLSYSAEDLSAKSWTVGLSLG